MKEREETDSVLFCGGLLWNIGVTRIKQLSDRYSFSDWFLIDLLKCIGLCYQRAKEFKVSKYFVKYICSVLGREVRGLKYRS